VKGIAKVGICLFFLLRGAFAQTPLADFATLPNACREQLINFQNNSTSADSYQWDFCLNDIRTFKSSKDAALMPTFTGGNGYKLVESNGQWIGFATSYSGGKLFRLDFGADPTSSPIVTNLGNPGGLLIFPEGIEIVEANGNWYGFVGGLEFSTPAQGIIRLDFGNSLLNIPLAINLGNFGKNTRFRDVMVVKQNSDLILLLATYNDSILRINYRNSFDNTITGANIFDTGVISGVSQPTGFDVVYQSASWKMLIANRGNNKLVQLNFGSDILSTPTVQANYSFTGLNMPNRIKILREGNTYYGVVSNESSALSLIDFKDLNPASVPVEVNAPGLAALIGIEAVRWKGTTLVQGVGSANTILKSLTFQSSCDAGFDFNETIVPQGLTYSAAGTKQIELIAFNSQQGYQSRSIAAQQVIISALASPDIDFTSQNVCANSSINFTSTNLSGDITSYAWAFGNGDVASTVNPVYVYTTSGTYQPLLTVSAANGCQNTIQKSLAVYNPPQANFTLPGASPFCNNQPYQFVNTSTFDAGIAPTWQWSINGGASVSTKDLSTTFSATTSQQISLVASIPGCSTQSIQTINSLSNGPLVNFSMSTGCQASPISFTNATSGAVTSYSWTFGDGNTSTQTNPQNTFANIGPYQVTLQANNAAGCQNSLTKSVTIYSRPQPDFSIGLPPFSCAGTASQFTDATPNPTDSNLNSWAWSFGDAANGNSTNRNPSYTYSTAASYAVSLTVGTNFGCSGTIQKSVTISPSPTASFSTGVACVNQLTQFTDTSTGSVQSRLWQIQSNNFNSPTPQVTFSAPGTFSVFLTLTGINGCISQTSKNVVVPAVPTLDFSVAFPCTNNQTTFTELTNASDPSISQSWVFGSLANGSGSPASFSFPTINTYAVKLNSTRQSGCTYSVSKNVSISNSPVANFLPSVESGAAPLEVVFANNSALSTSYAWKFGDSNASTSLLTNPTFTYTELGDYQVELTAFNALGCFSKTSSPIRVVVPQIDLTLTDFYFMKDVATGALQPVVTISNKSNVTVSDPYIFLDIAGSASIKKQVIGSIKPAQELTQTLDFQIVPQAINYACAEVQAVGDVDIFLNKKCISLTNQDVIFAPFPNPVTETLNMDWISIDESPVSIEVINSQGGISFQQSISAVVKGINRIAVNVETLTAGIYFIRFRDARTTKAFGFAVVKN
jgi:PKD repeat protein